MHHFIDTQLKGHVIKFEGPLELIKNVQEYQHVIKDHWRYFRCSKPERTADTIEKMVEFFGKPWPRARNMVMDVVESIKSDVSIPRPVSVKPKNTWDDDYGELVVDRAIAGDDYIYRRPKRKLVAGPKNIAILANVDTFMSANDVGVYWRSASVIAMIDILEELGYQVELWLWNLGYNVFPNPNHNQFVTLKAKDCGQVLDVDAMCDTFSEWFCINGIFKSFWTATKGAARSIGSYNKHLGDWEKHMDVTYGITKYHHPITFSKRSCVNAVTEMMQKIVSVQEGAFVD